MSQENVEAFKRGLEGGNRGDIEGLLGKTISIRGYLGPQALEATGLAE